MYICVRVVIRFGKRKNMYNRDETRRDETRYNYNEKEIRTKQQRYKRRRESKTIQK